MWTSSHGFLPAAVSELTGFNCKRLFFKIELPEAELYRSLKCKDFFPNGHQFLTLNKLLYSHLPL